MEKDQYQKELDRLREKYTKYRKKISSKIRGVLEVASLEVEEYFLSQGFIYETKEWPGKKKPKIEKYYYDPKTRVGIKIQYPSYIEVISDYNVISLQVHYKIGDRFFGYDNKGLNFFFKKEDPEKVFMRFKKKFKCRKKKDKGIFKTLLSKRNVN